MAFTSGKSLFLKIRSNLFCFAVHSHIRRVLFLNYFFMAFIFTDQNFQTEALQAKGLVVVDFWAPWCGPCQKVIPLIDKLAQTYPDVKIGKMNVDDNSAVPSQLGIMGIPAIKFFKNGKEVDEIVGAQPEAVFVQKIEAHRTPVSSANDNDFSLVA